MSRSTVASSPWRRARGLLSRPADPVEHTRWVLFHVGLAALVLTAPGAVAGAGPARTAVLAAAGLVLAAVWTRRYLLRSAGTVLDVVDVAAVTGFALACSLPAAAYGIALPAVWSRAMYGRTRHVVAYGVALGAGLAAAALARSAGLGPEAHLDIVIGALPLIGLTAVAARHLAQQMLEREQTRSRDGVLRALGTSLLGLTDPGAIRDTGWRAVEDVCQVTPGLRALAVAVDEERGLLRVVETAGEFHRRPATLPRELAPAGDACGEVEEIGEPAALAEAAGFARVWLRMPLPAFPGHTAHFPGAWMLLGAPDGVSAEAVTAMQSLHNKVALAMRSSQAHRDLETQALTDALTGLANRTAFTAALDDAVRSGSDRAWLLFLDLDDFKVVNDGLGHAAGDELLRHVSARMLRALREVDLCARLGGDEFAVLLRDAGEGEARRVAQRLVELLSAPVRLDGRFAQVGASVGLARLDPGLTATAAVQRADIAMYAAKAAGKNRVHGFTEELLDVHGTAGLEAELRQAVLDEQFVVHYQPIVATSGGRCVAVEALVRWDHPVRGLLAPDQFLAVAERTGIVAAIGEQVMRRACADAAGWQDGGRPVAVHVNVSPSQLAHPRFVTVVRDCLAGHVLAPKQLVVEITESTVLDAPAVRRTLDVLAAVGVGIAVDDFGTGYSALTTLRTLPVDIVKIDKSFVAGAATEVADQAVLEAIAQMADRLGLQTVAEGVECPAQQEFVQRAGITAVQGYLHQRPIPAAELGAWLEGRGARRLSTSPA
ncbi:putative bifunctional diguanylate cyclase/phosphodiesterase [Trujillonella humicola]|uniref:putative bifunctional diguanylate cyclase/phosphodiesterase n=1 Tax=Trujillonella humicola TaxID=3383699 RepID=UPI003906D0D7